MSKIKAVLYVYLSAVLILLSGVSFGLAFAGNNPRAIAPGMILLVLGGILSWMLAESIEESKWEK